MLALAGSPQVEPQADGYRESESSAEPSLEGSKPFDGSSLSVEDHDVHHLVTSIFRRITEDSDEPLQTPASTSQQQSFEQTTAQLHPRAPASDQMAAGSELQHELPGATSSVQLQYLMTILVPMNAHSCDAYWKHCGMPYVQNDWLGN